ncbi:MAG: hypothetical protein V3V10_01350, partial [Planctomycetota bacterium]
MDDIISSIRNIISDEPQESAPMPPAEAPVPVVQLTENQIAEPIKAAPVPDPVVEQAMTPPQLPPSYEPEPSASAVEPLAEIVPTQIGPIQSAIVSSAEVASEIQSVPGVMVAAKALTPIDPVVAEIPPLAAP